jgi:hypothetical protein
MPDFSKDSFFKFLDYAAEKNLVKSKTASGWRSASSKLMEDLSDAENADVRKIDIDLAVHRAVNRDSVSVSPTSLKTYQQRVSIAIAEFIKFQGDPSGYKPRGMNGQPRIQPNGERTIRRRQNSPKVSTPPTSSDKPEKESVYIASGLTLSYPLRSDFLAQVVIPRDLTTVEARRLGAFLLTIAIDYQPE